MDIKKNEKALPDESTPSKETKFNSKNEKLTDPGSPNSIANQEGEKNPNGKSSAVSEGETSFNPDTQDEGAKIKLDTETINAIQERD